MPRKHDQQQFPIRTKLVDGSGSVTLASYTLICMVVKQGTIERKQVIDIIHHFSLSTADPFCEKAPTPPQALESKTSKHLGIEGSGCISPHTELHEIRLLCAGILSRLATLRERIHAYGKAVLRPSNAIMGPPFAPALDYLQGLVREISLSAAATEEAAARKRARVD